MVAHLCAAGVWGVTPLIELLKVVWVFMFLCVALPVILVAVVACVVYEVLHRLWLTWCWLKEVGR